MQHCPKCPLSIEASHFKNTKITTFDMGWTLSALINMQLKQLIIDRRLTLDVSSCPVLQVDAKIARGLNAVHKETKMEGVDRVFNNLDDFS